MGVCGVGISAETIWLVHRPELLNTLSRPIGIRVGWA
jgi:hypothetical protein